MTCTREMEECWIAAREQATFVSGGVLSLGSLIGFITVLGIAARNGIMLVSHYRHLEEKGDEMFGCGLIRRGSTERRAPILMTAMTTALYSKFGCIDGGLGRDR